MIPNSNDSLADYWQQSTVLKQALVDLGTLMATFEHIFLGILAK